MLASYHCWVYKNHRIEYVEVLREWVIQEAEFQVKALETVQGISYSKPSKFEGNVTTKPAREHPRTSLQNQTPAVRFQVVFRVIGHVGSVADLMEHGCVEVSSNST